MGTIAIATAECGFNTAAITATDFDWGYFEVEKVFQIQLFMAQELFQIVIWAL